MMWYKNIRITLDACKLLKDEGRDFRMIMVGMGPEENQIKRYCAKLRLNDKVIFTGQILDRTELQMYYGTADLQVFPSILTQTVLLCVKLRQAPHRRLLCTTVAQVRESRTAKQDLFVLNRLTASQGQSTKSLTTKICSTVSA